MLIQQLNATDPDKVFVLIDNGEAATLPADAAVMWATGAQANGVLVQQPDTGCLYAYAGVLDVSLANATGTYRLAQVFGYRASSVVQNTTDSIAAGQPLVPVAGQNYLATIATTTASNAAVTQQPIFGVLLTSLASSSASATVSTRIFIRAM